MVHLPFGTWESPISADAVAAGAVRLSGVAIDGNAVYWLEGRPDAGGRTAIVRMDAAGRIADVTPPAANVRSRVHEYGGAPYVVDRGTVYYSEFDDQRLYRLDSLQGRPVPLTPPGAWRYADACISPSGERLVCVREDHTDAAPRGRSGGRDAVTTLVTIPLDGPRNGTEPFRQTATPGQVIVSGCDFYSTPRFSPDGTRLSWLCWNHPRMPWDGTELWLADVDGDGGLREPRRVAGGRDEAIFQPGWSPDGLLHFASDRSGWWNLYRIRGTAIEHVFAMAADFGRPQWQFGMSTWAFADAATLVVTFQRLGRWHAATIDVRTRSFAHLCTDLEPGENVAASAGRAVFVAGSAAAADAVVQVDLATGAVRPIRSVGRPGIERDDLSMPHAIEFPTQGGAIAHAFYYAPVNRRFSGPPGERPPLIVIAHGGPTASTSTRLNLEVQFWTSRGFAVADVNYGGSSGYGREYRRRLNRAWGIVDVVDCVHAARYLVAQGHADAARLIIRGRSAGGFTALAAVTSHPDVFAAAASYYGISDTETMARETHKFESHYLDNLIGPYPAARDTYRARSPIDRVDRIESAVVFFQGLEDRVVPPDQSETMAERMRERGLPVALLTFQGEQHGFRKRESIVRCLEAELAFYMDALSRPVQPR